MMKIRLKWLAASFVLWMVFWLGGWPHYYQQYSTNTILVLIAVSLIVGLWICAWFLKNISREKRAKVSIWIAFYTTLPFAIFDLIYCGFILGHGIGFFSIYWYLSLYYFLPWLTIPYLGHRLGRQ